MFIKKTIILIVVGILFRQIFLEPFRIRGMGMAPILQVGDAILTNKLSYGIRLPFATEPLLTYKELST